MMYVNAKINNYCFEFRDNKTWWNHFASSFVKIESVREKVFMLLKITTYVPSLWMATDQNIELIKDGQMLGVI